MKEKTSMGEFMAVKWLELHTFTAKGPSLIPGWGTKIPLAMQHGQNKTNKKTQKHKSQKTKNKYPRILM